MSTDKQLINTSSDSGKSLMTTTKDLISSGKPEKVVAGIALGVIAVGALAIKTIGEISKQK